MFWRKLCVFFTLSPSAAKLTGSRDTPVKLEFIWTGGLGSRLRSQNKNEAGVTSSDSRKIGTLNVDWFFKISILKYFIYFNFGFNLIIIFFFFAFLVFI